MYVFAPVVVFLLLVVAFLLIEPLASWRRALLVGSVAWGVLVTAITELLSLYSALTSGWLFVTWAAVGLALAFGSAVATIWRRNARATLIWRLAQLPSRVGLAFMLETYRKSEENAFDSWPDEQTPRWAPLALAAAVGGAIVILATTGALGLIAAPNNGAALRVSLARVMFWAQHGSLTPYPTDILAQLYAPPWADEATAHLLLLSGSDTLAAVVTWWSVLGSVIGVSLIAQQLGAPRVGQIAAAIFLATAPMAILLATNATHTAVAMFWLVCLVHFTLALRARPTSIRHAAGLGVSLGLTLLTDLPLALLALPLLLLAAYWVTRELRWFAIGPLLLTLSGAFILNVGSFMRNRAVFGALFGPSATLGHLFNSRYDPLTLAANLLGALSLQIATPPSNGDPGWEPWGFDTRALSEQYAGNPLHMLLLLGVVVAFFSVPRLRASRLIVEYSAALVGVFLLFALALRWSAESSAQELALLALSAPLVGLAVERLSLRRATLSAGALALVIAALPWLIANQSHPLIGQNSVLTTPRATQYFTDQPALEQPYREAAAYLNQRHCSTLGLMDAANDANNADADNYLWWALLQPTSASPYIEYVSVNNISASVPLGQSRPYTVFQPCAIVQTGPTPPSTVTYQYAIYRRAWQSGPVAVYVAQ